MITAVIQIRNEQRKVKKSVIYDILIDVANHLVNSIDIFKDLYAEEILPVISVLLTNDHKIRELNRIYRGQDRSTDVLSFPSVESNGKIISGFSEHELNIYHVGNDRQKEIELGDIAISVQTVIRQAEAVGNSFDEELRFLFIHSFLHLIGYDHLTVDDEKIMISKQKQLIEKYKTETGNDR
mgnify:CR=1 FL=1